MKVTFFDSAAAFRSWLAKHHGSQTELVVGLNHKDSGRGGLTYAQAVDEALCFGWIDGVRRKVDSASYSVRFTPRRPRSIWSRINVAHVERLLAAKRMAPPGLKAFEARERSRTGVYSFEQRKLAFDAALEKVFRAKKDAWKFWEAQPPGYRRTVTHWVMSAKQEETRRRRLEQLIALCARGKRLI